MEDQRFLFFVFSLYCYAQPANPLASYPGRSYRPRYEAATPPDGCQQIFADQLHRVTDQPHKVNDRHQEVTDRSHQARVGAFEFLV